MKQNCSRSGEKRLTGQSLSKFFDTVLGDFAQIQRTQAISPLNALKTAGGGAHYGTFFACSEEKLQLRRALNLINDTA